MPSTIPAGAVTSGCLTIRGQVFCKNNITQVYLDGHPRNSTDCTLTTCSLLVSHWGYLPNVPSNYFFLVLFAIFFFVNIPLGLWKKTWGVLAGMTIGCAFEAAGTLGRIQAATNPFQFNPFLIYIIFLTIGPAFLSAAIYLCLARIIIVYGEANSRFKPRTYSIVFMFSDFVALILQGAGGALAATAKDDMTKAQKGINIMIAGLAWQVASLTLFALAAGDIAWCVNQGRAPANPTFINLRSTRRFRGFLWALGIATVTIYIRSVYRVAELSQGFTGSIADQEAPYIVFEPIMITIACACLTGWHPSYVFGDMWEAADYRKGKEEKESKESKLEQGYPGNDYSERQGSSFSSLSSTSSEKHLTIKVYPDLERERQGSHQSNCSSLRRPSGNHHPNCPKMNPRTAPMRPMERPSITRYSISHKPSCPHHGSLSQPSSRQGSHASVQYYTTSHQAHDHSTTNLRTPMIRREDYPSESNFPGSRQFSINQEGPPPKTPAKDYVPERYVSSRQLKVAGAVTPRTPLLRREENMDGEDYGTTHNVPDYEVSPRSTPFLKQHPNKHTEW